MNARRVIEIDWPRNKRGFEVEGTMCLYLLDTTIDDWRAVIAHFESGSYGVRFTSPSLPRPVAPMVGSLVGADARPSMFVDVGDLLLACHFFEVERIELDLDPRDVTESNVRPLLELMAELGDLTGKIAVLAREDRHDHPCCRYAPDETRVTWIPP